MKAPNDNRKRNIAIYVTEQKQGSLDVNCVDQYYTTREELPEEIMIVGPEGVNIYEKTDMELPEWMSAGADKSKFQIVYKFKTKTNRRVFAHTLAY